MVFLLLCSVVLILNSLAFASLQGPPILDKDVNLFGQRFVIVPVAPASQQPEIDYYDAVAQGLDNDPPKQPGFSEPVVSGPDFDTTRPLKVSQKHLDTKQLINNNPFNVQTQEEPAAEVIDEVSSGEEPKTHLIDGETGPPSIQPPVARRFIQLD